MDKKEYHRKKQKIYADKHRKYYRLKNKEHNLKNTKNGYANKKQKESYKNFPLRMKARNIANNNNLKNNVCELCGSMLYLQCHHQDYLKPYDIVTLCRSCHTKVHLKIAVGDSN